MASLRTHKKSAYWFACYGKGRDLRKKKSTGILVKGETREETAENRRKAQAMADAWEMALAGDKTQNQIRRVMVETFELVAGKKLDLPTPRSFAERWLKAKKGSCEESTIGFYQATTDRFLTWLERRADAPFENISQEDVEDFLAFRRAKVGPVTVNHELKSLKTYFRAARALRILRENPVEFIKPDKEKTILRRPFTMDEIKKLLGKATDEWKSMIYCALYTGQRLADIATLRWKSFDLAAGEMAIVTRKNGRIINAPLPQPLKAFLEAVERSDGEDAEAFLHPIAAGSVTRRGRAGALSTRFLDLMMRAGIREKKAHRKLGNGRDGQHERGEVSFHTFRRTATTWLHEAGVPPAVVQALIGHDSIEEHQGYIAVGKAALVDAVTKFPTIDLHGPDDE